MTDITPSHGLGKGKLAESTTGEGKAAAAQSKASKDESSGDVIVIEESKRLHCGVKDCKSGPKVAVWRCEGCSQTLCEACVAADKKRVHGFCEHCESRRDGDDDARKLLCWQAGTCPHMSMLLTLSLSLSLPCAIVLSL